MDVISVNQCLKLIILKMAFWNIPLKLSKANELNYIKLKKTVYWLNCEKASGKYKKTPLRYSF